MARPRAVHAMPPRAVHALALATCLALALSLASGGVVGEGCICSDVRPRVGTGSTHLERFAVGATCEEVREAGDCESKWVLDTVKELEGQGYCMVKALRDAGGARPDRGGGGKKVGWRERERDLAVSPPFAPLLLLQITCGRCKCCKPVADTLRSAGLTSILTAAKGTPYETAFADPAWMGVVLAPKDGALVTDLESHILPPVKEWGNATWTADLLAAEESVEHAGGGRLAVKGAQVGRGRVVQGDIQACKAVVHVVDTAVA